MKRTEDRICVGAVLVRERDDWGEATPRVLLGRRHRGHAAGGRRHGEGDDFLPEAITAAISDLLGAESRS